MKFYLPYSNKYVKFEDVKTGDFEFSAWNVHDENGKTLSVVDQDGSSALDSQELIETGRILEIHKQIKQGIREYDPYVLCPSRKEEIGIIGNYFPEEES